MGPACLCQPRPCKFDSVITSPVKPAGRRQLEQPQQSDGLYDAFESLRLLQRPDSRGHGEPSGIGVRCGQWVWRWSTQPCQPQAADAQISPAGSSLSYRQATLAAFFGSRVMQEHLQALGFLAACWRRQVCLVFLESFSRRVAHSSFRSGGCFLQETRRLAKARFGPQSTSEPVFNPVELSASSMPLNDRVSDTNIDTAGPRPLPEETLIGTKVFSP